MLRVGLGIFILFLDEGQARLNQCDWVGLWKTTTSSSWLAVFCSQIKNRNSSKKQCVSANRVHRCKFSSPKNQENGRCIRYVQLPSWQPGSIVKMSWVWTNVSRCNPAPVLWRWCFLHQLSHQQQKWVANNWIHWVCCVGVIDMFEGLDLYHFWWHTVREFLNLFFDVLQESCAWPLSY